MTEIITNLNLSIEIDNEIANQEILAEEITFEDDAAHDWAESWFNWD